MSSVSGTQISVQVKAPQQSGLRSIVVGGLTGAINIMIVFPTEFVKTQLQLDTGREKTYTGSLDVVKQTVKQRGVTGLYRGVQVLLTGAIPTYALRFGTFDHLKGLVSGGQGVLSPGQRMVCGLGAGVTEAVLVVTWIETLKVRLISDQRKEKPRFRGLHHAAVTIVREEGLTGIYKGVGPTVCKQGSNQAIRFFLMETMRGIYTGGDLSIQVPYYFVALFGSIAGGSSVLCNTPFDVIKTRMQSGKYMSSVECVKHLARTEGVRGFYKGCLPRLNRVCLEVAFAFTIYDTVQKLFKKIWP